MRRVALLALCGCNQIYGLDATKPWDAAPDAYDRNVRLSLVVGEANETAGEAPVRLLPVPDPKPRIALVGKELAPARYVEDSPSGVVLYPVEYLGKQWRLEYTPPDSHPHEVQWSPADTAGHLVVPLVGRPERTTVPASTGYQLSMTLPSGVNYSFSPMTVIYTTGYWSRAASTVTTTTPTVDFATASPLGGGRGAPSDVAKDQIVAVDYTVDSNGCRITNRAGGAAAAPLVPGTLTNLPLQFETSSEAVAAKLDGENVFDAQARLTGLLGPRHADTSGGRVTFGRLAHAGLAFTTSYEGVPAPLHIPIAECPVTQGLPTVFDLGGRLAFTKATYVFVTDDRIVSGVRLRSSIAAIGRATSANEYASTFSVAATQSIKLGENDLGGLFVDGAPLAGDATDLVLGFDASPDRDIDYYEVTLYRLDAGALVPVRTYVGPDPARTTIRFDPSLLVPSAEHVFAVRTYRGRPAARTGDFTTVQGPQAVATIFSRTFRR